MEAACVIDASCFYVAGMPNLSKWSGLPILVIAIAFFVDQTLGVFVGKVSRGRALPDRGPLR